MAAVVARVVTRGHGSASTVTSMRLPGSSGAGTTAHPASSVVISFRRSAGSSRANRGPIGATESRGRPELSVNQTRFPSVGAVAGRKLAGSATTVARAGAPSGSRTCTRIQDRIPGKTRRMPSRCSPAAMSRCATASPRKRDHADTVLDPGSTLSSRNVPSFATRTDSLVSVETHASSRDLIPRTLPAIEQTSGRTRRICSSPEYAQAATQGASSRLTRHRRTGSLANLKAPASSARVLSRPKRAASHTTTRLGTGRPSPSTTVPAMRQPRSPRGTSDSSSGCCGGATGPGPRARSGAAPRVGEDLRGTAHHTTSASVPATTATAIGRRTDRFYALARPRNGRPCPPTPP